MTTLLSVTAGALKSTGGSVSATTTMTSKLWTAWFSTPQVARYFVAGNVGNVFFFLIERFFFRRVVPLLDDAGALPKLLRDHAESFSFFVSYLLQIVPQHAINALIVFGWDTVDSRQKYLRSLKGAYAAYSVTLLGSTVFNAFLLRRGVPKNLAFFGTLYGFAVLNFALLSMWEKRGGHKRHPSERQHAKVKQKLSRTILSQSVKEIRGGGGGGCSMPMHQKHTQRGNKGGKLAQLLAGLFLLRASTKEKDELIHFVKATSSRPDIL